MKLSTRRLSIALLIFLIAVILQIELSVFGWSWQLTLSSLITLAFFVNLYELLFFAILVVWILNWQPILSFDILIFGLLPVAAYLAKKFLPWRGWINLIVLTAAAILIFYSAVDYKFVEMNPNVFFGDLIASSVFGLLVFRTLKYLNI